MDYLRLTPENLAHEHICCALSNDKDPQVAAKKSWLADRMAEGLVFLKSTARGKCFIEYIPAEAAWAPIDAPGYLHIDCFWVSGALQGHGYANDLLDAAIADARSQNKQGLTVLSSSKKRPFLSDPGYLAHRGFQLANTAAPDFALLYLPLVPGAQTPKFRLGVPASAGWVIYYTNQCPFPTKYVPLLEKTAAEHNVPLETIHLTTRAEAQTAPCPFTVFSLFHDGQFVTHEILSPAKFAKILEGAV